MMVWLVGAGGMLGHEVGSMLDRAGLEYTATDLECDITDVSALQAFVAGKDIGWIVNCSAYTAVDRAESEEERAFSINADGVKNLAAIAAQIGAKIIHISTDYVFSGDARSPYSEETPTSPMSAYGRTKAAGEVSLTSSNTRYFIIRTAWLYGPAGKNFVYTMLRLMNERVVVSVVSDQHGTPTYAPDLAEAIVRFIRTDCSQFGIYHYTNAGETTWYEFAERIYRLGRESGRVTHECVVRGITTAEYPTPATRPAYSVLATDKIVRTLGLEIPTWEDGLYRFFAATRGQHLEGKA